MLGRRCALGLGLLLSLSVLLAGCGGSHKIGVAVTASATTVDGADTVTLTATVTNDRNAAGVSWTVSGGGSLSNTTTTSATYTAPAATSSSQSVTVTATSVANSAETGSATLTVAAQPTVSTTSTNLTGSVGTSYSVTLQGSGGVPPYKNWAVSNSGSALPACLTLSSAGVLSTASGTAPSTSCAGTYTNLIFTYQDSGTPTPLTATSSPLTVTIAAAPAIVFTDTAAALPGAKFNTVYSQSVAATGGAGALTYSLSAGALPTDLTLNASTGLIGGTPKAADIGNFSLTVTAADAYGDSATQTYTLAVTYPTLTITTASPLPTGYGNVPYSRSLAATGGNGGPYTWSVTAGGNSLTAVGLALSSGGLLSGTTPVAGTATFTVKAADSAGNLGTASISLTINPALSITTAAALPTGYGTVAYSQMLAATGGSGSGYAWSVTAGANSLTAVGLALSSGGVLSGATPVAGSAAFTAKVTDSAGNTVSQAFTLTIDPALTITTAAALPSGYAGSSYSQSLAATGGSGAGYTWSVTAGALQLTAVGLSVSSGMVSGATPVGGSATFTAKVTDSVGNTASKTFTVTIEADLTITTAAALPTGYGNVAYSQTLAATGGSGTGYTWGITAGASQLTGVGLSIASGGVVSGATPVAGSASFTVQVTDSQSHSATQAFTVTINPALAITTGAALPQGFAGTAYSQSVIATGGSNTGYTWSVTAGAPQLAAVGLSLSSGGMITGASPIAGLANFTAKVMDSVGNTASQAFSVKINAGLAITTNNPLPSGLVNQAYVGVTFAAGGGSGSGYTWTQTAANLPAGMLFDGSTAVLSGTPTQSGSFSISLKVTDSAANTASGTFTFTIYPALSFTPASLPTAYVGTSYNQILTGSGGSGAGYSFSITGGAGSLTGVGLNLSSAGVVSGTPTATGSPSFTVQVKDGAGDTASQSVSLTVAAGVSISTTSPLPSGYAGTAYSQTLSATGGTGSGYTWSVTAGAPSIAAVGLNVSSGGVVSGAAPLGGTAVFTVKATDSGGNSASATFSVTIEGTLTVTTATLPNGAVGVSYSQMLAASGGSGTYSNWQVTAGASQLTSIGLSLSAAGVLSGSSPTAGTANFTVQVTDSQSHTATQTFTVTVYAGLTITTTSLPGANVGVSYSQTLNAAGGSGTGYSWTAQSSNLATFGLSLSSAGVVSGTPTQNGAASFTAKVTDSASNTATQPLSITVYTGLSLPAPNPASLPSGYAGVSYTGSIAVSGGSGSYSFTVTGLSDNLSASQSGGMVNITGTPNSAATVSFNVKVTDTVTNNSVTQSGYSISITTPTAVSLPTPNPASLPSATVNQSYNGSINASGGVPPYTWTVNGASVTGPGVSIGDGLTASASSNMLSITGTPTTVQLISPINVQIQDQLNSSASNTYTIQVNPSGGQISGQIFLNNYCGGLSSQPIFSVRINTSPAQTVQTDNNGSYSFSGIPAGTYTLTPSLYQAPVGAEKLFYPASIANITVANGSNFTNENFNAEVGYTVSGNISYSGSQTGQVYIYLNNSNCGSNNAPGTSISEATLTSGGAYTIRGVPPGSYTAQVWMDAAGITSSNVSTLFTTIGSSGVYPGQQGAQNANNPTGSGSGFSLTNANATGVDVTLTDPSYQTPSSNPQFQVIPAPSGVLLFYGPSTNSNSEEDANAYLVQWAVSNGSDSDGPTCSLGGGNGGQQFATVAGSRVFFPVGNGATVWILDNTVTGTNSFTAGGKYCFQARSFNTLDPSNSHPSGWTTPLDSDGYPAATTLLSGSTFCSSNCTTVSGAITIPAGVTIKPGAPLYAGFFQQTANSHGPSAIYVEEIASPVVGANNFTMTLPSGSGYGELGILDQNNDGQIDVGDVTNVRNNDSSGITLSGSSMTGVNTTLPGVNSTAIVQTQYSYCGTNCGGQYNLNMQVNQANKLPVAVTLSSGPNLLNPVDLSQCAYCGNSGEYSYGASLMGATPNLGDQYNFTVTYSDGSQDTGATINGKVTAFGSTGAVAGANDTVTNMSPNSTSSTLTPDFTWTFPANPGNYTYQFYLSPQSNCTGNCNIWEIPGNNSNSNGFTYSQTGSGTTGTIHWNVDPTGQGNTPNVGSLIMGDQYNWGITVQDSNGNQAQKSVSFTAQ